MMKEAIVLAVVLSLGVTGVLQAQQGELRGVVDVTYQSKYIWRGFDIYGDKSAIQSSVDLDLFGTGFGISAMAHRANSSGYENGERWDYTLYYQNRLFGEESYATNYRLGWVYYNYPDLSRKYADLHEVHMIFSWPKICPAGVVPSYVLVKLWPSNSGSWVANNLDLAAGIPSSGTASGWAHIFMLDYGVPMEGLLPDAPNQVLRLHSELVFNDGVGPAGQNVDQDWSNVVFGAATDFDLGHNITLTPAVYHQITMEKTVNDDKDETWVTVGAKYEF